MVVFLNRNVIVGVAQFKTAGRQHHIKTGRISLSTDEVDQISTGSGGSVDSQNQTASSKFSQASKKLTSSCTISPQDNTTTTNPEVDATPASKSQSDSETSTGAAMPTRISSSSDIGYGSMTGEQKLPNGEEKDRSKIWGKMGHSFDQLVKSGISSFSNIAAFAGEASYYSPAGLILSDYKGDYSGYEEKEKDDDEEFESKKKKDKVHRRLDFNEDSPGPLSSVKSDALRLLRSVSFGNDTQIMSKLKELKEDRNPKGSTDDEKKERESSVTSTASSLENKITQYYEGSREGSMGKESSSSSKSREITPVDEDQMTIMPQPPRSPSILIRSQELNPASPARTPVTQDDPLGALSDPSSPVGTLASSLQVNPTIIGSHSSSGVARSPGKRTGSEGQIGMKVGGMRNVASAKELMGPPDLPKGFHRSSTLPNYASQFGTPGSSGSGTPTDERILVSCTGANNVSSGISAISSSFKNPFG